MGKAEFSADVIVSADYTVIGSESAYGNLTIGTAVTELMVGAAPVNNRTFIFLQADDNNTDSVYVGLDNTVSTTKYGFKLTKGQTVQFTLDKTITQNIFAVSGAAGQKVAIIEGAK